MIEAILEVINKNTVVGLYSPWDSDAQIIQDLTRHERVEVGIRPDANVSQQSETIQEIKDTSDQLPSCSSISQIQALIVMKNEVQEDNLYYEKKTILVEDEINKQNGTARHSE
nr:unnamed protein product [Callosobruchus analis]